jgi:ribonucleotide monophosphatase NagD (HAD superfamily)
VEDGFIFGSGSWGELFRYAAAVTDDRMHHAGKPGREFFLQVCRRLGVDPRRCLLIGDNLESDIRGGLDVGMTTAVVMSGVTSPQMLANSRIKPAMVFEDVADALRRLAPKI